MASDAAAVADALGVARFAVMGHSAGGPHALACAALLPERVTAAVCVSGLAPFDAPGLDWSSGMWPSEQALHRAARRGRAELQRHLEASGFDAEAFTADDQAALAGEWS